MHLTGGSRPHLTYCTNIHPGESWSEVRRNLEQHVLAVRRQVAPGHRFGIGLRLSGLAARELQEAGALAELKEFLAANDLYVFTINGFPYGPFHGRPVKEEVYRPDWSEEERLAYTNRLADILAELLPEGVDGTISTVPIAFAPRIGSESEAAETAARIGRHAVHLHRLERRAGKRIALALEPEPCCYLETVDEAIDFFRDHLFDGVGLQTVAGELGLSDSECREILRRHVGVCLDACHMAVEFEDPGEVLRSLDAAGIGIPKVQISAGLRVWLTGDAVADVVLVTELERFADSVYLHQVVESSAGGLRRFLDLPDAILSARAQPRACEWRVHFHVPLFLESLDVFQSTQDYVGRMIDLLGQRPERDLHWEVETYTWDVLPHEHRRERVADAVAREIGWVLSRARKWTGGPG